MAAQPDVVWVGDLGNRVTDSALFDVFTQVRAQPHAVLAFASSPFLTRARACAPFTRQLGEVAACAVVRDTFTGKSSGCGWVRFKDAAVVPGVLELCNTLNLFVVGARSEPCLCGVECAA